MEQSQPINNALCPISISNSFGNGFIVGNLFFTAGHVAKLSNHMTIKIGNETLRLNNDDAIILKEERTNTDGNYYDFAIYKLPNKYNDLTIDCSIPTIGEQLISKSLKHEIKKNHQL